MDYISTPQGLTASSSLSTKQMGIIDLCNQHQSTKIFEMIQKDPLVVYDVIPALLTVIKYSKPSALRGEASFDILYTLVENFGIPVVLFLSENHIDNLKFVAENGWLDYVIEILKSCLSLFSYELQKLCIKNIVSLAQKYNIDQSSVASSPNQINSATFLALFHQAEKLLSNYEEVANGPSSNYKKLASYIEALVSKINSNLEGNEMNILEENVLTGYNHKLCTILLKFKQNQNYTSRPSQNSYLSNNGTLDDHALRSQEKTKIPENRFRTSFILGETLREDESYSVEYKDYPFPFDETLLNVLRKTINGFLNRRGGRIYIGIDDDRVVRGIQLLSKDRDSLKQHIYMMIKAFEPPIRNNELVSTHFLPILSSAKDGEVLPGFFVVKIIVRQGDPKILYSELSNCYQAWIRNDAQVLALSAREISEQILKRNQNPGQKIPDCEFNDPTPDPIKDAKEYQLLNHGSKKQELEKVNIQPRYLKGDPAKISNKQQPYYANQANSSTQPSYIKSDNQTQNVKQSYQDSGFKPKENHHYNSDIQSSKPQQDHKAPTGNQYGYLNKPYYLNSNNPTQNAKRASQDLSPNHPKSNAPEYYQNSSSKSTQQGNFGNQPGSSQQVYQVPTGKKNDILSQQSKDQHWKEKYKIDPAQKVFRVDLEGLEGMGFQEFQDLMQKIAPPALRIKMFKGLDKVCNGMAFVAFDSKDKAESLIKTMKKSTIKVNNVIVFPTAKLYILE